VIDYCVSSVCNVLSGVPQGSVLGPILFLVFINDIDSTVLNGIIMKLFADDSKLYTEINCSGSSSHLQASLDNLCVYADIWQLTFNVDKCYLLSTCNRNSSRPANCYFINGRAVQHTSSIRDLGITITSDLHFNSHISLIVSKALQRSSILLRGFLSRDIQLMRRAFITYIRPLVEFNSVVWNPSQIFLIDLLESVQRKFTKRIPSISHLNYFERLKVFDLEPLELRRLKIDLVNYYKFLVLPFNPALKRRFTIYDPPPSSRAGISYLQKPIKRSAILDSSFFYRSVNIWNSLPSELRTCSSLFAFKSGIDKVVFNNFLLGSCFK
jgi:hypothetical protein